MKKIILYIASSINGYIAKPDGSVDWLEHIPNPDNNDYGFNALKESIDTTIQGNSSYKQILKWGIEFPYKNTTNYVITHNKNLTDNENVKFISEKHVEFIRNLKLQNGKDIWLIGGGQVNTFLLNANLIDEIHQFIMPIALDNGIRIFESLSDEKSFKIVSTETYSSGVIRVTYTL